VGDGPVFVGKGGAQVLQFLLSRFAVLHGRGSVDTLTYLFYQLGFEQFKMGQASAVAIIIVVITVALSYTQFRLSKKWVNY
jgi:ABC-type sugar transport system permease subunit